MKTNGSICIKTNPEITLDENRKPVRRSPVWSTPIPCLYLPNKYNEKGVSEGNKFTIVSYDILIEDQTFTASCIRLCDDSGRNLGEFQVLQINTIKSAGRLKITV